MGEKGTVIEAPDKEAIDEAVAIDREIRRSVAVIREEWVTLAGSLSRFHERRGWELAVERDMTLPAYLAQKEIGIKERQYHLLVQIHRELVEKREIPAEVLQSIEMTKVQAVLPAILSGKADKDEALADADELSVSDLRQKYRTGDPADDVEPEREKCPRCGSWVEKLEDES